jgi:hypothetical protein
MRFSGGRIDCTCRVCGHEWTTFTLADFNVGDGVVQSRSGELAYMFSFVGYRVWDEALALFEAEARRRRLAPNGRRGQKAQDMAVPLVYDPDSQGHPFSYTSPPPCPSCGSFTARSDYREEETRANDVPDATCSRWKALSASERQTFMAEAVGWALEVLNLPEGQRPPPPPLLPSGSGERTALGHRANRLRTVPVVEDLTGLGVRCSGRSRQGTLTPVFVVTEDVPSGSRLGDLVDDGILAFDEVPQDEAPSDRVESLDELLDTVTTQDLAACTVVVRSRLSF